MSLLKKLTYIYQPQHRVLLECVVDALDDAGYKPNDEGGEQGWVKSSMGVFVGSATDSYQNNLASNIDAFFCPGTIRGFASGRISHHFGFQGPSIVYDTACSSGLVALHSACQSLLLKECNAAIASGTNMLTSPEMFIGLSKGFFISNTGGCRTFDETADGYCRAEGVGVLVLKRLEDALRDNDKIDAIIVASGTNQSGPADSLTMPHAPTQSLLFGSNCDRANISPLAIRAVEAHGTGTQAGDYAEMEAIKSAFCRVRPEITPDSGNASALFVSSLKPNIGHSESASGIASVIKAVLMLRHKIVLPHIGVTTRLNPRLGDLAAQGIVIPTTPQPLQPVSGYDDIYISVNNFGAPGGNANVILQDAKDNVEPRMTETDCRTHHVIALSTKSHTPFSNIIGRLLKHLDDQGQDMDLASLSYSTTARRVAYPSRLAFSVSSIEELKLQLRKATPHTASSDKSPPRIGFILAGNGSQYSGMGKTLYESSPTFRAHIDHCNDIFKKDSEAGFLGIITGRDDPFIPEYDSFLAASVTIFSVGYAMGMMWLGWGVMPSVIVGHSLGEFAGLVLAGCLSVEDAIQLIIKRAKSIYVPEVVALDGGMLVLGVGESDARRILEESGCSNLNLSCYNGPAQTCISGPRAELLKLQAFAQARSQPPLAKILQSRIPWHSPSLEEPAKHFQSQCEGFAFSPAKIPMILNTTGSALRAGEVPSPSYLADQMAMPVRFDLCLGDAHAQEVTIWIELSSKTLLLPLLRPLVPSGVASLPTIGGGETGCWSSITKALARLYEAHVPVDWAQYHRPYQAKLVTLPTYPFARNEHWAKYRDRLHLSPAALPAGSHNGPTARNIISTSLGPLEILEPWRRYVLHTKGQRLHPGAYLWLALSCTKGNSSVVDFHVTNPAAPGSFLTVLVGTPNPADCVVSFVRHSNEDSLENGVFIASCKVESGSFTVAAGTEKIFQRSRTKLLNNPASSFFSKAMATKMLTASMETIGDQTLESLTVSDDGEEAVGQIRWDSQENVTEPDRSFLSSVAFCPSQLRALLQPACLAMFLSSGAISPNAAYAVARLDFAKGFDKIPQSSQKERLSVHVFLDMSVASSEPQVESSQSYVYSQNGSALARVMGFRKSATFPLTKSLSLELNDRSRNHAPVHIIHPFIPSPPDSAIDEMEGLPDVPQIVEKDDATLTESLITAVLAQELGIPAHGISAEDRLEDLGVDSIMSMLLRDQLSKLSSRRLKWFLWKRGLTVQDLCDHTLRA
ncbi:hypothetical protein B0H34DRAFT_499631 [Crassisporium funariophilum]|nr:hypothetical protein B0H34DRAFT_499631 [Crassisporium funariophilum]